MAILHDATITPGKRDLMKSWLPSRSWFDGDLDRKPVASFRFDDPAGEVGVECFLLGPVEGSSASTLLIPMSYRGAPLEGSEEHLIGVTDHSVLGKRWVYDGLADPVAVSTILTAILTGGHEAELTMEQDGKAGHVRPHVPGERQRYGDRRRPRGRGERGRPGGPHRDAGRRARLALARVVGTVVDGGQTLTAQWGDHGPVVVAAAR